MSVLVIIRIGKRFVVKWIILIAITDIAPLPKSQ